MQSRKPYWEVARICGQDSGAARASERLWRAVENHRERRFERWQWHDRVARVKDEVRDGAEGDREIGGEPWTMVSVSKGMICWPWQEQWRPACPGGRNFRVIGDKLSEEFFTKIGDEIWESPNLVKMLFTEFGDQFVDHWIWWLNCRLSLWKKIHGVQWWLMREIWRLFLCII